MSIYIPKNEFDEKDKKDLIIYPYKLEKIGKKTIEKKQDPIFLSSIIIQSPPNNFDDTQNILPVTLISVPFNYGISYKSGYNNLDTPFKATKFTFTGELWDPQKVVVKEVIDFLEGDGSCILAVRTGFGKTICCSYIAAERGVMTVCLMTTKVLELSWINTWREKTTANIFIVGGTKKDNKSFIKSGKKTPDVLVCMEQRVSHIPSIWLDKVGLVIIDEAHEFCTQNRLNSIMAFKPSYVIACTATPFRSDKTFSAIELICGKDKIVKINENPFIVYQVNTNISVPVTKNIRGDINWADIVSKLSNHDERNQIIVKLVEKNIDKKIIIMTRLVEHAYILKDALNTVGLTDVDMMASTKRNYKDSKVLIGTISKIGTGFDEANTCEDFKGVRSDVLILCISIKSPNLIEQVAGRIFRVNNPTIFYLLDDLSVCKSHWNLAKKWYLSRNGTIKKYII